MQRIIQALKGKEGLFPPINFCPLSDGMYESIKKHPCMFKKKHKWMLYNWLGRNDYVARCLHTFWSLKRKFFV